MRGIVLRFCRNWQETQKQNLKDLDKSFGAKVYQLFGGPRTKNGSENLMSPFSHSVPK